MSNLTTLPKGDSAWLLRKSIQRIMQQVSVLETNIGSSTTRNSADTQVIFNDNGTLRGDTGLTYDKSADRLSFGAGICYGLLTSASATITGDLTVDTSTLKVDSTNNRVGIGTATPAVDLHIQAAGSASAEVRLASATRSYNIGSTGSGYGSANNLIIYDLTGAAERYRLDATGNHFWNNVGGTSGTAMTLNSTGLGVGVVPLGKLHIRQSGAGIQEVGYFENNQAAAADVGARVSLLGTGSVAMATVESAWNGAASTDAYLSFRTRGSGAVLERLRIDSTGNVGIGVTPSAWNSSYRGLQLGAGGAISAHTSASLPWLVATSNSFINSVGDWKFINNGYSTRYLARGDDGTQSWWTSNNGSAGGTVSYTQAMTLDASGNLLVAATSSSLTTGTGFKVLSNSGTTLVGTVGASSSDVDTTYRLYSSTASAYRFYVGYGGTVYATNTTISAISDARLKENVQDIDVGLGAILALKPRKFDWKTGKGKDIKGDRGFIAQEFETVFPQLVDEWADPAPEGEAPYKSVRQDLIPVLVKAIQELTARVQTLEAK